MTHKVNIHFSNKTDVIYPIYSIYPDYFGIECVVTTTKSIYFGAKPKHIFLKTQPFFYICQKYCVHLTLYGLFLNFKLNFHIWDVSCSRHLCANYLNFRTVCLKHWSGFGRSFEKHWAVEFGRTIKTRRLLIHNFGFGRDFPLPFFIPLFLFSLQFYCRTPRTLIACNVMPAAVVRKTSQKLRANILS